MTDWTNYATRTTYDWITYDEKATSYTEAAAADALKRAGGDLAKARAALADLIRQTVTERAPALGASLYRDLLQAELSEINYEEIATAFLEDE